MSLADVASDPTLPGYAPRFFLCAAVACLFAISTVVLVIVLVKRSGRGSTGS